MRQRRFRRTPREREVFFPRILIPDQIAALNSTVVVRAPFVIIVGTRILLPGGERGHDSRVLRRVGGSGDPRCCLIGGGGGGVRRSGNVLAGPGRGRP